MDAHEQILSHWWSMYSSHWLLLTSQISAEEEACILLVKARNSSSYCVCNQAMRGTLFCSSSLPLYNSLFSMRMDSP